MADRLECGGLFYRTVLDQIEGVPTPFKKVVGIPQGVKIVKDITNLIPDHVALMVKENGEITIVFHLEVR